MNQHKMGEFLRELRKEKGLTQEELGEKLYVTSRTVSRWETGTSMPDLTVLVELADFYDVDIRELIDGERKSENMDKETKDTLLKVAEYADEITQEEKKKISKNTLIFFSIPMIAPIVVFIFYALFMKETKGALYGIIPENICHILLWTAWQIMVVLMVISYHKLTSIVLSNNDDKQCWLNKSRITCAIIVVLMVCVGLFDPQQGLLCNTIPQNICTILMWIFLIPSMTIFILKLINDIKNINRLYPKSKESPEN